MNDDNPYAFSGEIETRSPFSPLPPLPAEALRQVARFRRALCAAMVVYYLIWFPLAFLRAELFELVRDDLVLLLTLVGGAALLILAAIAMPWVSPRYSLLKVFAILVPILNVLVLAYVLYRSGRRLRAQGVRLGLFVDDFSQATFEPPGEPGSP